MKEEKNCEYCGASDATYTEDPFDLEVYNDHTKHWICNECASERFDDT